jgi:hypothetical protein
MIKDSGSVLVDSGVILVRQRLRATFRGSRTFHRAEVFEGGATMAQKLFVGGLAFATTNEALQDFFSQAGEVTSASVVTDRDGVVHGASVSSR